MYVYSLHNYSEYFTLVKRDLLNSGNSPMFTPKRTKLKGYQKCK